MRYIALFLTIFLAGWAVVLGVWSGDRDPPTETISVHVVPDVVPAGGRGEVRYVYRRYRLCSRRAAVSVIDATGRAFEFPSQVSPPNQDRVEGKPDSYRRPFRVSIAAQQGPAVYHVELQDFCNPLHWFWPISRTIDVPFQIGPRVPDIGSNSG